MGAEMIYQQSTATPCITLEQAKAHLRVDYEFDDVLIQLFIQQATEEAEHRMQREIIYRHDPQALATTVDGVPAGVQTFVLLCVGALYERRSMTGSETLSTYYPHMLDPFIRWNADPDEVYEESE